MSKETKTQGAVAGADSAASRRSVVVIGGGPGGSTAAALLARAGMDVLLLERDVFPRYHIGESLAVSCRVIMELSGAVDTVDSSGFLTKRGALLQWGAEDDWTIDWNALFGAEAKSWHVDRDKFDEILLTNAEKQGAEVVQSATVKKVDFDGDRPVAVEWVRNSEPDRLLRTHFDFLIDASGRAGVLSAQKFRNRHPHEIFRNVAIWGYWQGGTTLPNTPEGGINVISSPDGWYWVIPLRGGRRSVQGTVLVDQDVAVARALHGPAKAAGHVGTRLSVCAGRVAVDCERHRVGRGIASADSLDGPVPPQLVEDSIRDHARGPDHVDVGMQMRQERLARGGWDPGARDEQDRIAALRRPTGGGHGVRGIVCRSHHDAGRGAALCRALQTIDPCRDRIRVVPADRDRVQRGWLGDVAHQDHLRAADCT